MNVLSEEAVLKSLSRVIEPDLKKDLVSLKMVRQVKVVNPSELYFEICLTTPACPLKEEIKSMCEQELKADFPGLTKIDIHFSSQVISRKSDPLIPGVRNIIAVSSGKGGVGKSTVAANLALALASTGAKTGLLDADIYGPSVPILMGVQGQKPEMQEIEGKSKIIPLQKHGISLMSIGLLIDERQAIVWRGPMVSSALRQFFSDVQWGELDYLVVDLPPGTGDIHLTFSQLVPVTATLVVTTPQKVAVADARKGAAMFQIPQINVPLMGVVENMSWFSPDKHPDEKYFLFGKGGGENLAKQLNIDLLAQIPLDQILSEHDDNGLVVVNAPQSPTARAFQALAAEVARRLAVQAHLTQC